MQIVSGALGLTRVHFEAPPSERLAIEMGRLLGWLEQTSPEGPNPVAALIRAGIAHLWFESIHPFEGGYGRIGRAIAESALARAISTPTFRALSKSLLRHRKGIAPCLRQRGSGFLSITGSLGSRIGRSKPRNPRMNCFAS